MTLLEYTENFKKLNPSAEELEKAGLEKDLHEFFLNRFSLDIKNNNFNITASPVSIVKNCNTKNFSVFSLQFLEETKEILHYRIFSENEADSIATDMNTGEVTQILYTNIGDYELGYVDTFENLPPVANTEERFLKALYVAADMSSKIMKKEMSFDSKGFPIRQDYAKQCIQISGGKKFDVFWLSVLGAFE